MCEVTGRSVLNSSICDYGFREEDLAYVALGRIMKELIENPLRETEFLPSVLP